MLPGRSRTERKVEEGREARAGKEVPEVEEEEPRRSDPLPESIFSSESIDSLFVPACQLQNSDRTLSLLG